MAGKDGSHLLSSSVPTANLRTDVLFSHYRAESNGQVEGHITRLKLRVSPDVRSDQVPAFCGNVSCMLHDLQPKSRQACCLVRALAAWIPQRACLSVDPQPRSCSSLLVSE